MAEWGFCSGWCGWCGWCGQGKGENSLTMLAITEVTKLGYDSIRGPSNPLRTLQESMNLLKMPENIKIYLNEKSEHKKINHLESKSEW